MFPAEGEAGPNGQGKGGHKIQSMAFEVLRSLKVQGNLGEVDGPEILRGFRSLGWEGAGLRRAGICLEGMMQEEHVQKAEAPWNLGKALITGMKELCSGKGPEETLEVLTAAVRCMACVGGSHTRGRQDKGLGTMQLRPFSLLQREAYLATEMEQVTMAIRVISASHC